MLAILEGIQARCELENEVEVEIEIETFRAQPLECEIEMTSPPQASERSCDLLQTQAHCRTGVWPD